MATADQYLAAAANAEKAGDLAAAGRLRAKAAAMGGVKKVPDAAAYLAAAGRAKAAGDTAAAERLTAKASKMQSAPTAQPTAMDGPALPAKAETEAKLQGADSIRAGAFAAFEAANPALKGKYTAASFPKAGDVVTIAGGGGRSGGARYTVRSPKRTEKPDTWTDTASAMAEGPWQATKAFAGGLTGGPSPSRAKIAEDPLFGQLPGPVQTGLGAIGDLGMTALAGLGTGISGAVGFGTEFIPGLGQQTEQAVGEGALVASQFAVPELAGVSSTMLAAPRMAGNAPKAATVSDDMARLADDVAAADRAGIPVMRTDVSPPKTFIGKVAQKTGESIPIAGTGGMRAKQNAARIEAAQNLAREFGGDAIAPAIDDVTASVLAKRQADLTRLTGQKTKVISVLSDKGAVPVPKATAAIDQQIALLKAQRLPELDGVISRLEGFKASFQNQPLDVIERNRAALGKAFADPSLAAVRDAGEKALSAIYGPLRDDMAGFIKANGGDAAHSAWKGANDGLSAMAGELKDTALKRVLSKGDETPETVRRMLFSQNPSDVKRLYKSLTPEGQAAARTAVIQEALGKSIKAGGDIADLSPEKFKAALGKMGNQIGVFFKGEDYEAVTGLIRALKLTERASTAGAAPLTGIQNLPAIMGIGLGSTFGLAPSFGIGAGIGAIARVYESTGVQRALRVLAKAPETSSAHRSAVAKIGEAFKSIAPAAGQAANQAAAPDYDALYGRY